MKSHEFLAAGGAFSFLQAFWPDLYALAVEAEDSVAKLPVYSAVRLRGFAEAMLEYLFRKLELGPIPDDSLFERLLLLERDGYLERPLLAKFHTIRKLGNNAAHNGSVSREQAESLIEDAWSLASWFCRYMRPEIDWLTPRTAAPASLEGPAEDTAPLPTTTTVAPSIDARVRRVREDAAVAMNKLDPLMRTLRTRMQLREVFDEELTPDQHRCILALEAFLADDRQRVFLLKGYAGTGKTFLAAGLADYLLTQGRAFSLAAPTGRAAKLIGSKTRQPARTIHSLIYDYKDMTERAEDGDEGSATFKMLAKVAQNEAPINAVYIVDEASLVSNAYSESEFFRSGSGYLLQDLIAHVGSTTSGNDRKIVFIGDPAQLPPVGMPSSPALDEKYLRETFGIEATGYELTEIVRQQADSAVIRNVLPLRESLAQNRFGSLNFTFDDDVIRLNKDDVTPLYMKIREVRGPQAPVLITYSNTEAAEFNRAIRARIFPGEEFVTAGDTVMVAANGFCATRYIANGEILRIETAEPLVERRSVQLSQKVGATVETLDVALTFRDVTVAIPQPEGDDLVLSVKILDGFLHGNDASLAPEQQRALYVDFRKRHKHLDRQKDRAEFLLALRSDPYFNALRLRFGYAITCHKAQGGEWSHVIASCETKRNPRSADYFRWLYTAMTRTSGKLYLVSPPDIRLKQIGAGWVQPALPDNVGAVESPLSNSTSTEPTAADAPAVPRVSPQASFRQWLHEEVSSRLSGTGIEIEDVAHHEYQEAYFVRRSAEAARINIGYKGTWMISGIACPRPSQLSDEVWELFSSLVGQKPGSTPAQPGATPEPTRPFLKAYHDRLVAALRDRGIKVADLNERQWTQRYTLGRDADTVIVDVGYDGRDRVGNYTPVKPSANPGPSLVSLQADVLSVLDEVRP